MSHEYTINVADGTYAEDAIVPLFFFERAIGQTLGTGVKGLIGGLEIYGNQTTPTNVKLNSILFCGGQTYRCKFEGFEIVSGSPYADADAGLEARRGAEVVVKDVVFNNAVTGNRCCSAYGGIITIKEGVHIGTGVYAGAFAAKVGGSMMIASNDPSGNPNSGSCTGNLFNAQDGRISVESDRAGGTPFTLAQFSTTGAVAASGGENVIEWGGSETALLHDVRFVNEKSGVTTGTTDANGQLVVPHTLDVTPDHAIAMIESNGRDSWTVGARFAPGAVNTTFYVTDETGAAVASTSVTIHWTVKLIN